MLGPVGIGVGLWGRGGVDAGEALLKGSLFWGSTLDATSPDRVATREAVSDWPTVAGSTLTQNGVRQDGSVGALRLVPTAGSYPDPNSTGKITANAVSGLTEGGRSTVVLKYKADTAVASFCSQKTSYFWLNGSYVAQPVNDSLGVGLSGATLPAFPYRSEASKRYDDWQEIVLEYAHTNAGSVRFQTFIAGPVAPNGTDGVTIESCRWYQSPLATLPNRASGGAVASVASEAAAPLLERPLAQDQSQHRGAWVDGSRCIRLLGVAGEYVDISGASALNGTDANWAVTFTWQPAAHPAADADVLVVSGATASLKITHLATGYLKVTRIADDSTSVTATCSRKVGTVAHTLTVQCVAGSLTFWSQGVQWGASKAFTSGKVATFSSARLGGSTWQGAIAECVIAAKGYTGSEIAAQHSTLCIRRSLPVGAREAWLMNGQSNAVPSTTYPSWGFRAQNPEATRLLRGCRGVHFEGSEGTVTYLGWGPARFFGLDRRLDSGNLAIPDNYFMGQEVMLHHARNGIATIRYAVGGQAVSSFAPGGPKHAAMVAAFDSAIEEAGVPLIVRGCLYVNGEAEVDTVAGTWSASMASLHAYLGTRYGSGGTFCSIHRRIPTSYAHGAKAAGVAQVQSEMDAWVTASPTTRAGINMEDMTDDAAHWDDYPTNVHGGTPQRYAEGIRFAAAIAAFG